MRAIISWPIYRECATDKVLYCGYDVTTRCPECGVTMRKGFDYVDMESAALVIDTTGLEEQDEFCG